MNHLTAMISEVSEDKQHLFVEKIKLELDNFSTKEDTEQIHERINQVQERIDQLVKEFEISNSNIQK